MQTKYKSSCAGCYTTIAVGETVAGAKIAGYWSFLCAACTDKVVAHGTSAWCNVKKALEALAYYNCDLADELDHHDWDLLRVFGITPYPEQISDARHPPQR